jgi:hypothetical protein
VHLVYATTSGPEALALAGRGEPGYLFVTSGFPPNPWSARPGYLAAELRALTHCGTR